MALDPSKSSNSFPSFNRKLPLRPPVQDVQYVVRSNVTASGGSTGGTGGAVGGGCGGPTDSGRTQTTTDSLVNSAGCAGPAGQGHVHGVKRNTLPLRPPLPVIVFVPKELKESSSQPGAGAGVDVTGVKNNPDSVPVRMAKWVYKGKTRNLGIPVEDYKKLLIKAGLMEPESEPKPKPTLMVKAAPVVVQVKTDTVVPVPATSSVNPKPVPVLVNPKPDVSFPATPNRNPASSEIGRSPLDNNNHNRNGFGIGPSPSASVGTRVSDSDSDAGSCVSLAVGRKTVKLAITPAKYLEFLKQAKLI